MAGALADIHELCTDDLPELPRRNDPLPEVFDYLPSGDEWQALEAHLRGLQGTAYAGQPCLLHGDYWPENILWGENGEIAAVLDWEDAALGDPLSDVAACRVELRYKFGVDAMGRFTRAYEQRLPVDHATAKILRHVGRLVLHETAHGEDLLGRGFAQVRIVLAQHCRHEFRTLHRRARLFLAVDRHDVRAGFRSGLCRARTGWAQSGHQHIDLGVFGGSRHHH